MKKDNPILNWLFNPFKYIAGVKALIAGWGIILLLSFLAYMSKTHFDGAIDIHYACLDSQTPYYIHLLYQVIGWGSLTIVMYITARIATKSTNIRLIDIAGTLALSQTPLLLAALLGFLPQSHICFGDLESINLPLLMETLNENIISLSIIGFIIIIISIWSIVLKYNAYSVSTNIKGITGGISFAIALIIAEIISKVILYLTLS
ncbi:MAG: hypothetical protein LBV43_13030 [Prevotella sp.]|jgi:hypothetical protein|nr:hypothetical protein [Prevotella sp.]